MKKLLMLSIVLISYVSYGQNQNFNRSVGFTGGGSLFFGDVLSNNVTWGSYVDFGKVGLEYNASVDVNYNYSDFINGVSDNYKAGVVSKSIGFFLKPKNNGIYYGGGIQMSEEIGVRNVLNGQYIYEGGRLISRPNITTSLYDENKIYPYVTLGYTTKLNDMFSFKGGLILSKSTILNVGFGFNF